MTNLALAFESYVQTHFNYNEGARISNPKLSLNHQYIRD